MNTPQNAPCTLDQYKAYLLDLGNIGSRYVTSNGFYLSVISALLGILSLVKSGPTTDSLQVILRLAVPLFAIFLCHVWRQTIVFYRALFKAKFAVLKEMELSGDLFPAYEREEKLFAGPRWLLNNEARIPYVLSLPFFVIFGQTIWALVN